MLRFKPEVLATNQRSQLAIVLILRLLGLDVGWLLTMLACFATTASRTPDEALRLHLAL